jgi:hypothetical protein
VDKAADQALRLPVLVFSGPMVNTHSRNPDESPRGCGNRENREKRANNPHP